MNSSDALVAATASAAVSLEEEVMLQLADASETEQTAYKDIAPDIIAVVHAHIAAPPSLQYSHIHIANRTGLDRERVKQILKMKEFENASTTFLNAIANRQVRAVHKTLYLKALSGSAPHMKLFLERFDKQGLDDAANDINPNAIIEFLRLKARISPQQAAALIAGKAEIVLPESK